MPSIREALEELRHDVDGLKIEPASRIRALGNARQRRHHLALAAAVTASGAALVPVAYVASSGIGPLTTAPGSPSAGPSGCPPGPSAYPTTSWPTNPSAGPSTDPSDWPSADPSTNPSTWPSTDPSTDPSTWPSSDPSTWPSTGPSSVAESMILLQVYVASDATPGQIEEIGARLRALPGVRVEYRDRTRVIDPSWQQFCDGPKRLWTVDPRTVPSSFLVFADPGYDRATLLAALNGLGGVGEVRGP